MIIINIDKEKKLKFKTSISGKIESDIQAYFTIYFENYKIGFKGKIGDGHTVFITIPPLKKYLKKITDKVIYSTLEISSDQNIYLSWKEKTKLIFSSKEKESLYESPEHKFLRINSQENIKTNNIEENKNIHINEIEKIQNNIKKDNIDKDKNNTDELIKNINNIKKNNIDKDKDNTDELIKNINNIFKSISENNINTQKFKKQIDEKIKKYNNAQKIIKELSKISIK